MGAFDKYFVFRDLLQISQEADKIIEQSFAETAVDDRFFDETRSKILQILSSKQTKRKFQWRSQKVNTSLNLKIMHSCDPLLEYRSHVHVKNKNQTLNLQESYSCNKLPLEPDTKVYEVSDKEAKPVTNRTCIAEVIKSAYLAKKPSVLVTEDGSGDKVYPPCEANKNGLDLNHVFESTDSFKSSLNTAQAASSQIPPSFQELESLPLTPDRKIQNYEMGKTYVQKKSKFNNFIISSDKRLSRCKDTIQCKSCESTENCVDIDSVFEKNSSLKSSLSISQGMSCQTAPIFQELGSLTLTPDGKIQKHEMGKTYVQKKGKFNNCLNTTQVMACETAQSFQELGSLTLTPGRKIQKHELGKTYVKKKSKFNNCLNITQAMPCQTAPNIQELETPDRKIQKHEVGKTYVQKKSKFNNFPCSSDECLSPCKDATRSKTLTILNTELKNSTNESLNIPEETSNKCIFHDTLVLSSDSSKEMVDSATSEKDNTIVISSDNSKENIDCRTKNSDDCATNSNNKENNDNRTFDQDYKTTATNSSRKRIKRSNRRRCHDLSKTKLQLNQENIKSSDDSHFQGHNLKISGKSDRFPSFNVLPETKNPITDKQLMTYRLRSLENKCRSIKQSNEKSQDIEKRHCDSKSSYLNDNHRNYSPESFEIKLLNLSDTADHSVPLSGNERNYIPVMHSEKRKYSCARKSSSDSTWEVDKKFKSAEAKSYAKKKKMATKRKMEGEEACGSKKSRLQSQNKSSLVPQKSSIGRKLRSDTEFLANCNRQSLKVLAEEKRKQREMRVQKTKERRECLEKERRERMRLSEQRLKQRFQQHEEILKQKTEKFKINSRNRQPFNSTKGKLPSTSSKDSKEDRGKDNDDFCRNSEDSGQKLSKESNGYHDVSLRNADFTSLEGNAGINPEISEEHNAIPVGCGETPVEFSVSCNDLKKAENVSVSQDVKRLEALAESPSECLGQQDGLHQGGAKQTAVSCYEMANASDNLKDGGSVRSNNKEVKYDTMGMHSEPAKLKKLGGFKLFTNQPFLKNVSKDSNNSHFLMSAKKANPKKRDSKDISASPVMLATKNEPEKVEQKFSCEMISPSPKSEKSILSSFCFNYPKLHKLRKNLKGPANNKTRHSNCLMQSKIPKISAANSNKKEAKIDSEKALVIENKKPKLTSYRISDAHDTSFDEIKVDSKKIPQWATGLYLKQALLHQHYKPPDVEKLFGSIPVESVDLVAIFERDRPEYHKRTSSEHWSLPPTPNTQC